MPRYWNVVPEQSGAVFFCSEQNYLFGKTKPFLVILKRFITFQDVTDGVNLTHLSDQ